LLVLGIQSALLALASTPVYSRPSDSARDLFIETAPNVKIQFAARQLGLFALYADDPESYTRGMMRAIIKRPLSSGELDALVADALKTPTAIGEAMLVADLFSVDRSTALTKIDRPTLVIASGSSPELEAQKKMMAKLPQGRFEVMQDAGHAVFVDQPEQFDRLLTEFPAHTG
jgi:non-heme chloroperoxidase